MNLLVISDRYPHKDDLYSALFVKKLIDFEKKYLNTVHVISLNPWVPPFIAKKLSNPRWYKDSIAQDYSYDNVHVYFAKYLTGKNMFFLRRKDKFAYPKVDEIIKKNKIKFDIIHAHFVHPAGTVAVRVAQEYNKPLVITAHAHEIREYPFMDEKLRDKILWALNNSDAVITVSHDNVRKMREFGFKGEVYVIPNGYDPEIFKPIQKYVIRKELNLPIDKKIIVSVGRLIPVKGHQYFLVSLKKLIRVRKDILSIIIGDGPLMKVLQKVIFENKLNDYIKLLGELPNETVAKYIAAGDLFVLPSLDEGNPTVMFESLGCGTPFVGTIVGGIPEIIKSEDYGLLCPPKNSECLAEKINTALEKNWDKDKILEYAEQFTWEKVAKETLKIYDRVL